MGLNWSHWVGVPRSLALLLREVVSGSVLLPTMDFLADPVSDSDPAAVKSKRFPITDTGCTIQGARPSGAGSEGSEGGGGWRRVEGAPEPSG